MPFVVLLENTELRAVTLEPDLACRPLALPDNRTLSSVTLIAFAAPLVTVLIASSVLSRMTVFLTFKFKSLVSLTVIPFPVLNLKITQSSTLTVLAWRMLIPFMPLQNPSMEIPRIVITSVEAALMTMPFTSEARIEAKVPVPSRVIDFVIVTAPKPPGSSASISPQAAVLEMAPAQVLQGAVRLQGLASSPTPDTHVREAWAWAIETVANMKVAIAKTLIVNRNLLIFVSFSCRSWGPVSRTRIEFRSLLRRVSPL